MKVLIADKFEKSGIDALKDMGCDVINEPGATPETLADLLASHAPEVLVVRSTKVKKPAIEKAESVKLIVRAGAGVDNIDLDAATAKGIAVCNCPGMNSDAVAELTMGLLLALDRRIVDQTQELRAGKWNKKEYGKSRGLRGRTLGIVGVGAIGAGVVKRARAFGMQVIAWSRSLSPEKALDIQARYGGNDRAGLLDMLKDCDAVSVHVAATPDTKGMCDAEFFGAMKKGAYFINTSRGSVVDEAALRKAVQEKGIRAGLDVYDCQPGEPEGGFESETIKLPGVYGTHHCGASTDQAQMAVADETVRIIRIFKESGGIENCVNREAVPVS